MCRKRLAENTARKKVAKNRHLSTIAQLCRAISSQLRHASTIGKNLLSINMSSSCLHNMVNFGPLTAEIHSTIWLQSSLYKTLSGKVVAHSIAFRVVSIYWQGDDPFTLKSCIQVTCPLLSMVSYGRCQSS